MADRFSEPSGSLGVHRFHCWPAGSDNYDHAENTQNWDKSDAIIGVPSEGTAWPPTEGVDGGIYREIALLQLGRTPIGTVSWWFRPTVGVPLTTITDAGWEIADGSTVTDHDFPGIGSPVALPNLVNRVVVGADSTKTLLTAGVITTDTNIDVAAGAPGPQGTGGSNKTVLTEAQLPAHNHGGGSHRHTFNRQVLQMPNTGLNYLINVRDAITHTEQTNLSGDIITTQGSGSPHDNRPLYIGLIPIVKVRYVDTL